jgi:ATP-dependent helicase/nuclease subunit A
MNRHRQAPPVDQDRRDRILTELRRNVLVEAAAGTGKTTCMLGRMISLLRTGTCGKIRHLAAVTFTRKAAAELRGRFQIGLEKAAGEAEGRERENLEKALEEIEQCFIGTIHSFCARLLRERPVEARVDLDFREVDEEEDGRLRKEAWDLFTAGVLARDPGGENGPAEELERIGLGLQDLETTFGDRFANFPDVDEWPVPQEGGRLDRLEETVERVRAYADHMRRLAARLPRGDWGTDSMIWEYVDLPRRVAHCRDLNSAPALMEILERFSKKRTARQNVWMRGDGFTRDDVRREQARWDAFRTEVAEPMLRAWHELRYGPVIRILQEARRAYDDLRQARGLLNYQDLLMKAAALLRDKPLVRAYFAERFRFLLVDEFQDTDPVQAEVMLLLTASDNAETRWRLCRPRPGSLFVVGDPKQSIYRFRRADIVTYNEVKEIIGKGDREEEQGLVLDLTANFRTSPGLIEWVNRVFGPQEPATAAGAEPAPPASGPLLRFPARASEVSPAYVPLSAGRVDGEAGNFSGPRGLLAPESLGGGGDAAEYDADRIARTIRQALDTGMTVTRTRRELEQGRSPRAVPSDFLIVTRNTTRMSRYARKLQEYGIPHQVTGGTALNEVRELRMLHTCLQAVVHPDNPVALVAALRSELFGVSDRALFAFRRAGGKFRYHAEPPRVLGQGEEGSAWRGFFLDAFGKLRTYDRWLSRLPAAAAMERIAADLGLFVLAGTRPGGDVEAGSLAKALEILRGVQQESWTTVQVAEFLGRLAEAAERHDGISARPATGEAVRIMNLHKVKGLEAAVVFLADPCGESTHPVDLHIDRSGEKIRGYMVVYGGKKGYQKQVLARPEGWASRAEVEERFANAEGLRLRYVAATRAGSALIVTQRTGRGGKNGRNPWKYFGEYLAASAEFPDPGPVETPAARTVRLEPEEARRAEGEVRSRREKMTRATLAEAGAKQHALAGEPAGAGLPWPDLPGPGDEAEGEHGVEWGTVIHDLLETAMKNPAADLVRLSGAMLPEHGLDAERAGAAADLVRRVMRSGLWQRALRSPERYTEIPFQIARSSEGSLSFLIRGAIDLVFREEDGWVLVDYKTDRVRAGNPADLATHYAPQVRLYAEAWEEATGQKPKETALYFVREDLYVPV